ncbi:MAG: aminotransferase class I/II-fold pyridoxal phosphate-dependent enzyme, partial [Lentisphaeria bacterium]|nr:aminotransferase class I/II-fold pyridoxal phosphate-dependent enzyme [Lentisphaeria bacterium]
EYTYYNFIGAAKLAHIILEPVKGDRDGMIPQELEKLCSQRKISGIFLMPSCANPTTISLTEQRRKDIAGIIKKHDLILIEDDHSYYASRGNPLFSYLPDNTVYICGSSMSLCSGLRITFAAFADKFQSSMLGTLQHLSIKTSSIDAELVTELINSGRAERILKNKKRMAEKANAIFDEIFPEYASPHLTCAPFRALPLCERLRKSDGNTVEKLFLSHGVNVFHSSRFAVRNDTESFLRLSLSSAKSLEELENGLKIVRDINK